MGADRLVAALLLVQARGRVTAAGLVARRCARTDLSGLSATEAQAL